MKHYLSPTGQLFAYESDGSQDELIPADFVPATDAQVHAIQNPVQPVYIAPLTPRQIRMALSRAGLRTTVEAAVTAGSQDLKDWWEWSQTFERLHPEVVAMGAALGQTDAAMDALWALGVTL
jgi:hypothetical protein